MKSRARVIASGPQIDKVAELVAKFGGKAADWKKLATVDAAGAEIHWYECDGIGKVGVKYDGELDPFLIMRIRMLGTHPTEEDPRVHQTLTVGESYLVITVMNDDYRVIDDSGEPIVFPKDIFEVLDRSIPPGWEIHDEYEGAYYLEPTAVSRRGFFEEWHESYDRVKQTAARRVMRETLEQMRAGVDAADRALIDRDLSRLRR